MMVNIPTIITQEKYKLIKNLTQSDFLSFLYVQISLFDSWTDHSEDWNGNAGKNLGFMSIEAF